MDFLCFKINCKKNFTKKHFPIFNQSKMLLSCMCKENLEIQNVYKQFTLNLKILKIALFMEMINLVTAVSFNDIF